MGIPYTLLDASSIASASVGWAWIVHIRSSTVASSSIATTASAICSVACGPIMWTPENFAVVRIGHNLDETLVLPDNGGARVRGEWKFPDLHVVTRLVSFFLGQADAADFRMTIGGVRNVFRVDGFARLSCNSCHRNNTFHSPNMRQLRCSEHDVSNGIDAWLVGLHPAIGFDEAAVRLDAGLFEADVFRARLAAHCNQNLLRFNFLLLASYGERHRNSRLRLFDFFDHSLRYES